MKYNNDLQNTIESMRSVANIARTMASPMMETQKMVNAHLKASGMLETVSSMKDTFKTFESLGYMVDTKFENESLLQLKINEINDESINLLLNEQIEDQKEKDIIDESFDILCEISSEFNILKSSITSTKYKRAVLVIFLFFVMNSFNIYSFYNQLSNNDIHYQSNCNNLRIRSTPTSEDNTNIITKINKNVYVEKIGSKDKWVNVRFEYSDGVEKEGWIYRTKLTKIED